MQEGLGWESVRAERTPSAPLGWYEGPKALGYIDLETYWNKGA